MVQHKTMASIVRPMQTKQRNCTNSQSIIYLTDLTNIYQEQDCLTTKPPQKKRRIPVSLVAHVHTPPQTHSALHTVHISTFLFKYKLPKLTKQM